jgi:hypothetical protein
VVRNRFGRKPEPEVHLKKVLGIFDLRA